MPMIKSRATVGPDGMVRLDLSVGAEHAGEEVEVTVEPASERGERRASSVQYPPGWKKMTQEEWVRHIESTAGTIDDPTFVRPAPLPLRDRGVIFD